MDNLLPFLKWAGGKRWLLESYAELFNIKHKRYIEPFLGSGAAFFKLLPMSAVLSDCNSQLIETYTAIRNEPASVVKQLKIHHRRHSTEYYYFIRQQKPRSAVTRAARFIYLNRTCWNGLYRVNYNGEFNVPIGTKSNVILPSDDFERVAAALTNAELVSCDFEESLALAGKGDFIFVEIQQH